MFPDSEIDAKSTCGPDKQTYLCVYGLAPYFESKLEDALSEVPVYSVSFDESFNRTT